ncbi:FAD/NAD(P)-binding protein [Streptomyces sp. NRRL S-1824]|uniref:FAD/NAD(P)-binding protein n=1 Tax=Streptomyces sp. NRRL S-1824 TaxID=1463889 RepID=UPI00099DF4FC|nr:FAD/NAD(P)-binding protein [Streptomyces sp. NRRL S-1824]
MRIAIIGGGAAAVSLLDSLVLRAEKFGSNVEICIYDPSEPAHGQAFGPDLDCALLNLPNGVASIRLEESDHFLRWLEADSTRQGGVSSTGGLADSFFPRRIFGSYLEYNLNRCRVAAVEFGWKFAIHSETVTNVSETSIGTLLVETAVSVREYTGVVLAIGPGDPADPYNLRGTPRFHPTPYPLADVLPKIEDPRAHVLIIGTGLTAIDATIGLLHLGHQGPITMASRQGILPEVRATETEEPLTHITVDRVRRHIRTGERLQPNDIWMLLREELEAKGLDAAVETSWFLPGTSARDYIHYQLTHPDSNSIQSILMRISVELGQLIRSSLSSEGVRGMVANMPRLKSLQCPMPWSTAQKLLVAMDSGQLSVESGITDVRHDFGSFSTDAANKIPDAQIVIDATRTSPAETKGRSRRLIDSLNANGLATWDGYHGLCVDPKTGRLKIPSGESHPSLLAIGEITAGKTYYASSLRAVNRGAEAVADSLLASIVHECPSVP